ncbi:solute carrier family 25 member 51 [Lingula anatina]|uniref:Solute carrier family 25 member 51 n=1 Tax=Lingula anatina TaxID=7574 RepID=A0A1S3HWA6_LINAN|nr:solute carrier family 25 member 51 [Lingula anatina]|eukprot:XP_013390327.1 solute carrier family 25 member 51 [Lingula anatina]
MKQDEASTVQQCMSSIAPTTDQFASKGGQNIALGSSSGPTKTSTNGDVYKEFISGWGAAVINISLTFPLNKVMFRQQLHGIRSHTAFEELRKEGLKNLYRGLPAPLLQKTCSLSIMFGCYEKYLRLIRQQAPKMHVIVQQSTAAILAGCTEALLMPLERTQVLLLDKAYHDHFQNTWHALRELKSYGVSEYYRGLTPILLRNGLSNAVFFGFRTRLKEQFPSTQSYAVNAIEDFVSGACLGAFISTVFYPVNVVKTHMQKTVGGPFPGIIATGKVVFEERGRAWKKMFRGVHVNYTRSFLSWGIINASYELLRKLLRAGKDEEE